MANKIYGDISSTGNIQINGSNAIREINEIHADDTGDITIPVYDKLYIENMIVMSPITRIGTQDYLPLNISGSFSGATNYIGKGIYPNIIESDGTLVYLRPGTNGSTFNYYYSYAKNARETVNINPISTTSAFVPKIFTSNHKLTKFIGSNVSSVLMMLCNDGTQDTYILSLTNKTLNPDAHVSVEFPASLITEDPQYCMIESGVIYIWCMIGYGNTSQFGYTLYTINVSDVQSGVYTSLQKITGFSGVDLYGSTVTNSSTIKLTDQFFNSDVSAKPLYNIPDGNVYSEFTVFWGNNEGSIQAAGNGAGKIRVSFYHACETVTVQSLVRDGSGISLVYDVSTKQYTLDTTGQAPVVITTTSTGEITYNNPFNVNPQTTMTGISLGSSLNRSPNYNITDDGMQFVCLARHDSSPDHYITRSKISNFTSLYDSWNVTTRTLNSNSLSTVHPSFGSAIGENMIHPTIISSSKILMRCSGEVDGTFYGYDTTAYTALGTSRNYVYQSVVNNNTINGYAPNVDRGVLDNSDFKWTGTITVVDTSGNTTVYGSSFLEGVTKTSGGLLNQSTMQFGTSYTLNSTALLTTMKSEVIAKSTIDPSIVDTSLAVLYYVPNSNYTKSYALVNVKTTETSGTNMYALLAEVDVTVSGTNITAISTTSSTVYTVSKSFIGISLSTALLARMGGLVIAQYSDFTYLGVPCLFASNTSNFASFHSLLTRLDNSTKLIAQPPKLVITAYNSSDANTYEVGVLPGVGFGLFENGNITDIKTKLVFKNFGTTLAQFNTMYANYAAEPVERIVVASQEVAEGFILYVSQTVPVLINGSYYTIPATTIDLTTVDSSPANKTFYVYVVNLEGTASYQLSTTLLSEELWRAYIGTVQTGASSISTVEIEKVTRFLTYRTSTTKRGSAIPTSTGVPSAPGTRWN